MNVVRLSEKAPSFGDLFLEALSILPIQHASRVAFLFIYSSLCLSPTPLVPVGRKFIPSAEAHSIIEEADR